MHRIEHSILIDRSAADIYAYVNDFTNDVHWRRGVRTMMQSTPTVQVGTEMHEVLHFLGREYNILTRVTEVVPNHKTAFQSTQGQVGVSGWRLVEVGDDATRFTMHTEVTINGLMRLAAPLLARAFSRQMRADLIALKRLLETS